MIKTTSSAKMFLAEQRECKENHCLRRFSTFNFENFFHPDKVEFGRLYLCNDELLAAGKSSCFSIERDSYIVILPITGSVNYLDDAENEMDIDVEEMAVIFVEKSTEITLRNPYTTDSIHYLCIGLYAEAPMPNNPQFFNFDLQQQNALFQMSTPTLPFSFNIGRLMGRKELAYALNPSNKIFIFVIAGAFEIDGRLIHQQDSIGLWDTNQIELEALSDHAVLLLLELK